MNKGTANNLMNVTLGFYMAANVVAGIAEFGREQAATEVTLALNNYKAKLAIDTLSKNYFSSGAEKKRADSLVILGYGGPVDAFTDIARDISCLNHISSSRGPSAPLLFIGRVIGCNMAYALKP
jgi:hypothetical protein